MMYVIRNNKTGRSWSACMYEANLYCNIEGYQVEMGETVLFKN